MRTSLTVLGILAGHVSLVAFVMSATGGSDIQLIAAGAFGTMCAVCFGFSATLAKLEAPKSETPADLARELLAKWHTMEGATRDRLARSLITKLDATVSDKDLLSKESMQLRSKLTSVLAK